MSAQVCTYAELINDLGDILSILGHYQSLIWLLVTILVVNAWFEKLISDLNSPELINFPSLLMFYAPVEATTSLDPLSESHFEHTLWFSKISVVHRGNVLHKLLWFSGINIISDCRNIMRYSKGGKGIGVVTLADLFVEALPIMTTHQILGIKTKVRCASLSFFILVFNCSKDAIVNVVDVKGLIE